LRKQFTRGHRWPERSTFRILKNNISNSFALLDSLIDEVGENESHPLASLMEILGVLIEKYEDEHVPELAAE